MAETAIPHSASEAGRSHELQELAAQLYALISSGHDALAYNVDAAGAALTTRGADGRRRAVQSQSGEGDRPAWQRARELVDGGGERDRRFNPWVLQKHLTGRYSVAPAAAGWVQWVALDIDAHPAAGAPELVARRVARARADRVLAGVWRALNCSAERHPMVLRSPGGGYHVWLPLTRGPTSSNPEHTWPAAIARAWVERHLVAAGLEIAPGVLEVYPSGRCLRAPCGRGMVLLQATRPSDPDALGLQPWSGTMADQQRIDWRGERAELATPVRRVVPLVRTFVAQWEAQRRTLADWLGRSEAAWDPAWGFLGWREDSTNTAEISSEIGSPKKNRGGIGPGSDSRSQQSDDVPGRLVAGGTRIMRAGAGRAGRGEQGAGSGSSVLDDQLSPSALDPDRPPDSAGDRLVRGRAWKEKVRRLLRAGVTEPSTRHDAVLTLAFYWGAQCGLSDEGALARLEAWCRAHPHPGSQLADRPPAFRATCLREARHYLAHHGPGWPFRGQGGAALATLTPADQVIVAAVDPRVADEVAMILAWLAGRAGDDGRIAEPVQLSARLLERLCGDRRLDEGDGKRHRATALALIALEQVGVLTMADNYRVGHRGRTWSCWYRFGSGELPRAVSVPAATWDAIEPFTAQPPLVPTLALVETQPPEAPSAPVVELRVVGERAVPEGVLRVLTDGSRGAPRTLLTRAPGIESPIAGLAARAPWFERAYLVQPFTPGRLWSTEPAMPVAFPDVEARRRMTRRERLAWGGGGTGGPRGGAAVAAPVIPLVAHDPVGERDAPIAPGVAPAALPPVSVDASSADPAPAELDTAPIADSVRAELGAEVGDAAAAELPLDLLDVIAHAWRGFRRGRDP